MPNKFFIFGATYNGDGTTSSEAASAGAAGAWNQEAIFTGTTPTYGSLGAGDVVYIRSKTGAGADANKTITVSTGITLGNTAATHASPITWILDNGSTWSGIDGVLEWDCTSGTPNPMLTIASYNRFIAKTQDALFADYNVADPNVRTVVLLNQGSYIKGWKIDNNDKTGAYESWNLKLNGAIAENCHLIYGRLSQGAVSGQAGWRNLLINPWIELVYTATPSNNVGAVFHSIQASNRGGELLVFGGKVDGAAADDGYASLVNPGSSVWACNIELYGTQFPKQMPFAVTPSSIAQYYPIRLFCVGADDGYGSAFAEPWGTLDSRNITYNYPTLNATMPDAASTPWSWRFYTPYATHYSPAQVKIGKLYTSAAATKTVTLELLTATTWTASLLDKADVWMTVSYVNNADNLLVTETTRLDLRGTALDTSSASWSTTAWGAVSCNKKKLSLTTQNSIKQNTMVLVVLHWTPAAGSTNEQVFVCPDVQLT